MLKIGELNIAATWQDVLFVGASILSDLEKFTLDVIAEAIIKDAADGFIYELTLNNDLYTYTRQAGETNAQAATNWIADLLAQRTLFYDFSFSINADFDDTINIHPKQELILFPIAAAANITLRESADPEKPLKYGGRSNILLETGRRCKLKVYGDRLGDAQKYLATHFAAQSLLPPEGRGTISSEAFEGESTSWLIPTLNPKAGEEDLMTIFGKRFMNIRKTRIVRYRVY